MPHRSPDAFLGAVFDSTAYALIATRPDGIITLFNPAAVRLLGWTAQELVDVQNPGVFHDPTEVVHRAAEMTAELGRTVLPGFEVFVLLAREQGVADERPWTYVRKDGGRVPVLLSVTAVRDANGTLTGYLGVARDVSALRLAEREASEGEQRFRAVFESAADGIYVLDGRGDIIDLNPAAAACFGWSVPELLGRSIALIMPEAESGTALESLWLGKAASVTREIVMQRRDATRFPAEITATEAQIGGRLVVICTVRDISLRHQAAAALREGKAAAESANLAKNAFLANVSHEIRTPLNGIVGMTGLLLDSGLDVSQREHADAVRGCADSLLSLVNDLLDFSKIEAGRLEFESIPFDPCQVCADAVSLFAQQASGKQLQLRLVTATGLHGSLLGDPGRFRQVLVNLLGNAVKFTMQGEIVVEVRTTEMADGQVELAGVVRDTGIGMDAAGAARLFQPFTQADVSMTRRFGGTGMGLSICRQLTLQMGGGISVSSEPGRGSVFRFTIRCPIGPARSAELPAMSGETTLKRLHGRVLIADDNAINQRVALALCAKLGLRADAVADGAEAVSVSARVSYDMVLMDCQMPEMDGYAATAAIRSREATSGTSRLPIIALTAHAMRGDRDRCIAAGMDDYLSKPIRIEELSRVAARHLHGVDPSPPPVRLADPAPAVPSTVSPEVIIDPTILAGLRHELGLDADLVISEMLIAFSEDTAAQLAECFAADTASALSKAAHRLRGSALNVGAVALAGSCAKAETAGNSGDLTTGKSCLLEMEKHLRLAAQALALPPGAG